MSHQKNISFLLLTLVLMLSACSKEVVKKKTVRENQDLWLASKSSDYEFNYAHFCFCPGFANARVVVRGDSVAEVLDRNTGATLLSEVDSLPVLESYPEFFYTVDGLFELILEERKDAYLLEVEFNETEGYPERIGIDRIKRAVDDELTILVDSLEFK